MRMMRADNCFNPWYSPRALHGEPSTEWALDHFLVEYRNPRKGIPGDFNPGNLEIGIVFGKSFNSIFFLWDGGG